MTIHKEGFKIIGISMVLLAGIAAGIYFIPSDFWWLKYILWFGSMVMFFLVLQFFRFPMRKPTKEKDTVIAPADGRVVVIEEITETEYFNDKRIQVSIFMSPLNVHINWYPIKGKVVYSKYHPGKFLVAWHPKSSTENERTTVVVEDEKGRKVMIRQIAGAVARRIVCYSKEGQNVDQGDQLGFIKFGSRVDLILPPDSEILAKLEFKPQGSISRIAKMN